MEKGEGEGQSWRQWGYANAREEPSQAPTRTSPTPTANNTRSWPAAVTTLEQWRRYTCLIYIHVLRYWAARGSVHFGRKRKAQRGKKKERAPRGDKILRMEINSTERESARRDETNAEEFLIEVLSGTETPLLQTPLYDCGERIRDITYVTKYLKFTKWQWNNALTRHSTCFNYQVLFLRAV